MKEKTHFKLLSVDRFMAGSKESVRFYAHSIPSSYADVPFDTLLSGLLFLNSGERPVACKLFARRISGNSEMVILTLKFGPDLESATIRKIEESNGTARIELVGTPG